MDRITRKELKRDKFALEVEHTVEYLGEHRKQVIRYGTAAAVVIVLAVAVFAWRRHAYTEREYALNAALDIQNAPVGTPAGDAPIQYYPTEQARNQAAQKAFGDLAAKYSGTDQGTVAEYYLGVIAASEGRLPQAERAFRDVIDSGNSNYGSLAKLAIADVYNSEGKPAEGEKALRSLMEHPTDFVSKEQATVALARLIAATKPQEARKLLEPLRTRGGAAGRIAITALGQLPQK